MVNNNRINRQGLHRRGHNIVCGLGRQVVQCGEGTGSDGMYSIIQKLVCREQKSQTRGLGTEYLRANEGSSEPMADLASVWVSGLW
jgi:hypothetical protein